MTTETFRVIIADDNGRALHTFPITRNHLERLLWNLEAAKKDRRVTEDEEIYGMVDMLRKPKAPRELTELAGTIKEVAGRLGESPETLLRQFNESDGAGSQEASLDGYLFRLVRDISD